MTTDQLYMKTLELLENEWLREADDGTSTHPPSAFPLLSSLSFADSDSPHAAKRKAEMKAIRKLFVPELIFRLHFGLAESGPWIPS